MDVFLAAKQDLLTYPNSHLSLLSNHLGLPLANKDNDKAWMIALHLYSKRANFPNEDIFTVALEKHCDYEKHIVTIPAGTTLYRATDKPQYLLTGRGDHWSIPPVELTKALKVAGLESMYDHEECTESKAPELPIAHAGLFLRESGRVYEFETTQPLRLVIICECLHRLDKDLYKKNINLVNDENRRIYYCGAFANSLKNKNLDGYIGKDAGLWLESWEVFLCDADKKLRVIGQVPATTVRKALDYFDIAGIVLPEDYV